MALLRTASRDRAGSGNRLPVDVQLSNVARDVSRRSRYLTVIALALLTHTPFRLTMVEPGQGTAPPRLSDRTRCNPGASDRRICLLRGASAFRVSAAVVLWQCEGAIVWYYADILGSLGITWS